MQHNLVETLVGAFVVAVSAIFLSYGYSVSDMSPKPGYKLVAEFDRIDGLTVGSDVRMSGIKVGTVIDQELNKQNFYATVTLTINDDIELPDDTSAKITMEGLLGGNYGENIHFFREPCKSPGFFKFSLKAFINVS